MSLIEHNEGATPIQGGYSDPRIWYWGTLVSFAVLALGLFMNLLTAAVLVFTPALLGAFVAARRQNSDYSACLKTYQYIDDLYESLEKREAARLRKAKQSSKVHEAKAVRGYNLGVGQQLPHESA